MPPPISDAALRRQTVPNGAKQQRVQGKRHGDTAAASVANTLRHHIGVVPKAFVPEAKDTTSPRSSELLGSQERKGDNMITVWLAMRCPWGNSQQLRKASLHGDCGCVLQAVGAELGAIQATKWLKF
jgi:hypothetical protein